MNPSDEEIVLRCTGLTKDYDAVTALDSLDLEIRRGQVFGYVGHNGAGKTTTIRILAGLLKPSSGQAEVCGINVRKTNALKPLVGYMPDAFGVYDQMRVWEYLDFFGAAFKIPRRKRNQRVDEVLELTEGNAMRDRFVDTLSKGMKQRVGIARTLMHDPQVLLLDEPASGLDPRARVHMRQLLRRLADAGKTLVVSSHILPELAAICDCVGILHAGSLRAFGSLDTVLGQIERDRLMEVKLLGHRPAAAILLNNFGTISKIEPSDIEPTVLRFRFSGRDSEMVTIIESLNGSGARVTAMREVPMSLEDAYMAISGIDTEAEANDENTGGDA
jgi:ABC-2 type transport system ATP-binding protein